MTNCNFATFFFPAVVFIEIISKIKQPPLFRPRPSSPSGPLPSPFLFFDAAVKSPGRKPKLYAGQGVMMRILFCILSFLLLPEFAFGSDPDPVEELRNQGRYEEALRLLEKGGQDGLEHDRTKARLYLHLDRLREAADLYEKQCRKKPSYGCWTEYGIVNMAMGGYELALDHFEKALRFKQSATGYSNLAVAHFYLRQIDRAYTFHRKAVELDPNHSVALTNYAIFLFTQRQNDEARPIFHKVVRLDPKSFYAHLFLGRIHAANGQHRESIAEYDRGIAIEPNCFDLYYWRACSYFKLGDYGNARSDLRKARRIEPLNDKGERLERIIRKSRPTYR